MTVFWFLLYAQKERPGGEPYRLCTLQNQCAAVRRDKTMLSNAPAASRTGYAFAKGPAPPKAR